MAGMCSRDWHMTRMWCVDPRVLCREHLLGEHNELHKLVGSIRAGHSIDGYVERGQVETGRITARHEALAAELERRGYTHESPLDYADDLDRGEVDPAANLEELATRCAACRERIDARR